MASFPKRTDVVIIGLGGIVGGLCVGFFLRLPVYRGRDIRKVFGINRLVRSGDLFPIEPVANQPAAHNQSKRQ